MSRHISIEGLLEALDAASIDVCILRNHHEIPASIGNDVDIVVRDKDLTAFRAITTRFAAERGLRLVSAANHRHVVLTRFLGIDPKGEILHMSIDEERGSGWLGSEYLSSDEILEGARRNHGFLVPRASHEAVITLLTGLLIAGSLKEKHIQRVGALIEADHDDFKRLVQRAFGTRLGADLERAALAGERAELADLAPRLRRANIARSLVRQPVATFRHIAGEVGAQARLKIARRGLVLNLVGRQADSLSTLARDLADELSPAFKGSAVFMTIGEPGPSWRTWLQIQAWVARERLVVVIGPKPLRSGRRLRRRAVAAGESTGRRQILERVLDALSMRRDIAGYATGGKQPGRGTRFDSPGTT